VADGSSNTPFDTDGRAIAPSLAEFEAAARRIAPHVIETPVCRWPAATAADLFGPDAEVWVKLELLQVTGSFKARGALNNILSLPPEVQARGFTAFSSGNHAAAVSYAAKVVGSAAKVVMLSGANPARIANCRRFGGEIVFADSGAEAAELMQAIEREEGRVAIHPYEGFRTSAGAGTLGLELARQIPGLDAVVVAIGGGGLCSGIGPALALRAPDCQILAVEPEGADTMRRSFASGVPERQEKVGTIADSLAPPAILPYSMSLCRQHVDVLEMLSDDAIRDGMHRLLVDMKFLVEPGGAATTAGALGPLRARLAGKRTCIILCGSNIDTTTFDRLAGPSGVGIKPHDREALPR
jgi:threonine dehydratase